MAKIQLSTTIDAENYNFAKEKGIKISTFLNERIMEMRLGLENGTISGSLTQELADIKKNLKTWQDNLYKMRDFLEKRGFLEEFYKEQGFMS